MHSTNGNGHYLLAPDRLSPLGESALAYIRVGLPVFPCRPGDKRPITGNGFKAATLDEIQVRAWWQKWPAANIGIPTEGFVVVDVDGAENPWPTNDDKRNSLHAEAIAVAVTPRGGKHYWFVQPDGEGEFRNSQSGFAANVDLRCDGGYVVVPPSVVINRAYSWERDIRDADPLRLNEPPDWLLAEIRGIGAAVESDTMFHHVAQHSINQSENADWEMPVMESEINGPPLIVRESLPEGTRHNALLRYSGAVRRYGMGLNEITALLREINRQRCQPELPDSEVVKIAEWAAQQSTDITWESILSMRWEAAGKPLSHLFERREVVVAEPPESSAPDDPGAVPSDLLSVPGFIGDVMALTLSTAPYPNRALAFAGALSLQSFLCARRVRDNSDTRPNIYLLALADSGTGKEWPRKVNGEILASVGAERAIGDSVVSAAGIEDAIGAMPAMLFQTDEIDALLLSINRGRDERWALVMQTLLKLYSQSSGTYAMRKRAGGHDRPSILNPHLTLLGTAVPKYYYENLSARMLSNGFFARMLIVEAGKRGRGRDGKAIEVPSSISDVARWWQEYRPGGGNLEQWNPRPVEVPRTPQAKEITDDLRAFADNEYAAAQSAENQAACTLWARATEHAQKLALLYACSANHQHPVIDATAAEWGGMLAIHIVRRMLFQVSQLVADSRDESDMKRILAMVANAPEKTISHRRLLWNTKLKARALGELIDTLVASGKLEIVEVKSSTKAGRGYRIVE